MCHLAPRSRWSGTLPDLCFKTRLPLRAASGRVSEDHLCSFSPWWGQTRGRFADTFWGSFACLFLSVGLWSSLAPGTTQLQIKDCPFGPQPTHHSVAPHPVTNNYNLWNSTESDWCKTRQILKGITVKTNKDLLDFTWKILFPLIFSLWQSVYVCVEINLKFYILLMYKDKSCMQWNYLRRVSWTIYCLMSTVCPHYIFWN